MKDEPEYSIDLRVIYTPKPNPRFEIVAPTLSNSEIGERPLIDFLASPIELSNASLAVLRFAMQFPTLLEETISKAGGNSVRVNKPSRSHFASNQPSKDQSAPFQEANGASSSTNPHHHREKLPFQLHHKSSDSIKRSRSRSHSHGRESKRPKSEMPSNSHQPISLSQSTSNVILCLKNLPDNPESRNDLRQYLKSIPTIQMVQCRWDKQNDTNMNPYAFVEFQAANQVEQLLLNYLKEHKFCDRMLQLYKPSNSVNLKYDRTVQLDRSAELCVPVCGSGVTSTSASPLLPSPSTTIVCQSEDRDAISGSFPSSPQNTKSFRSNPKFARFRIKNLGISPRDSSLLFEILRQAGHVRQSEFEPSPEDGPFSIIVYMDRSRGIAAKVLSLNGVIYGKRPITIEPLDECDFGVQPEKKLAIFLVTNIAWSRRELYLRKLFYSHGYVNFVDFHSINSNDCVAFVSMVDDHSLRAESLNGVMFQGRKLKVRRIYNPSLFFSSPEHLNWALSKATAMTSSNVQPEIEGVEYTDDPSPVFSRNSFQQPQHFRSHSNQSTSSNNKRYPQQPQSCQALSSQNSSVGLLGLPQKPPIQVPPATPPLGVFSGTSSANTAPAARISVDASAAQQYIAGRGGSLGAVKSVHDRIQPPRTNSPSSHDPRSRSSSTSPVVLHKRVSTSNSTHNTDQTENKPVIALASESGPLPRHASDNGTGGTGEDRFMATDAGAIDAAASSHEGADSHTEAPSNGSGPGKLTIAELETLLQHHSSQVRDAKHTTKYPEIVEQLLQLAASNAEHGASAPSMSAGTTLAQQSNTTTQ